jgi:N-dimethylarginine dimethylaminohydrolase
LSAFFADTPTICVAVNSHSLHLKSKITNLAKDTFVVAEDETASSIKCQIQAKSPFSSYYNYVTVSTDTAANVLAFNNYVFYLESAARDAAVLDKALSERVVKIPLCVPELAKLDGSLTCTCVLFSSKLEREE